jgi:chromosome segregation ATPase
MHRTPNADEFDGLKKRQHALPSEIKTLRAALEDPEGEFRGKFIRFQNLWEAGQAAIRHYRWTEPAMPSSLQKILPTKLDANALSQQISELLATVDPLVTHFADLAKTAEGELRSLENKVKTLRSEIARINDSLTAEELPLHEALSTNLGRTNVQLLGNLCSILDDEWTDALEINFGHKLSSVVSDEKIKTAFEIFNSLPRTNGRERLLCRADMKALSGTIRRGSLAEKITSSDPAVMQLLAHLLGDIICCRTIDEVENHPRSILPSGAIKQHISRKSFAVRA